MAFSIQDYEIIQEIGKGGFGTVFKAKQRSLGKIVAIKSLASQRTVLPREIIAFRHEAEAMALLSHDNIITIYDYACIGNSYYIVMEYIDGMTLESAFEQKIAPELCLLVLEKIVSGLRHAHANRIVHRDLKPANILLSCQGQVKIADFGLSTLMQEKSRFSTPISTAGTLCYMAPEAMVNPAETDNRVDIFSLGAILYQALASKLPFAGSTIGEISYKILNDHPEKIETENRFQPLASIAIACLEKERENRPVLEEVLNLLRTTLGERYHLFSEKLTAFVVNKNESTAPIIDRSENRSIPKKRQRVEETVFDTAAIILFLLVLIIGYLFPGKPELTDAFLPGSNQKKETEAISFVKNGTSLPGKLSKGAIPKPQATTSPDISSGELIISGLLTNDTIRLNGTILKRTADQNDIAVFLQTDHYVVLITGGSADTIQRTVRIMPYQRFVLDLTHERRRNGQERTAP